MEIISMASALWPVFALGKKITAPPPPDSMLHFKFEKQSKLNIEPGGGGGHHEIIVFAPFRFRKNTSNYFTRSGRVSL